MFDILIHGGTVIDGTGAPSRQADVAITGDTIAEVGKLEGAHAQETVDGRGMLVCPGFIDMHSHSDFNLLVQPPGRGKIMQGITTEVIGNCGMSGAPLLGEVKALREKGNRFLGIDMSWSHFDEFAQTLKSSDLACNIVPLIGHGNIRGAVLGYGSKPPSPAEMAAMKELLTRQMEAGAWGLSTGLVYPPGIYSALDEIAELGRIAARFGGIYATHMRSEGDELLESIAEALDIGRHAGIAVQISHLKTQGKRNWHKLAAAFDLIEQARAEGLTVFADRYPYTASSTGLDVVFPAWACEGGTAAELERLQSPALRDRIYAEILEHMTEQELAEDILITRIVTPKNKPLEGLLLGQAASKRGQSLPEALFSILREEDLDVDAIFFSLSEENLREILQKPYVMVGSDASVWDTDGVLCAGKPHPRAFGTFPLVLQKYVFKEKLLPVEEAVHKMTSLPARALGLEDRGSLLKNMKADLVLVHPRTVGEKATYRDPHHFPEGIHRVMVNGIWETLDGEIKGTYAGKLLLKH